MGVSSTDEVSAARRVTRWRWWVALVLLAGYVLGAGLEGLIRGGEQGPVLPRSSVGLLKIAGVELVIFGMVFGLAWLVSRASREDLLLRWRGGLRIVPLGLGYSVALRVAVAVVMMMISGGLVAIGAMDSESL
jgi:hypothetical protein